MKELYSVGLASSLVTWVCLALGLLVIFLLAPRIATRVRLKRRAREDYLRARGTLHRKMIGDCLVNLNREIYGHERELRGLEARRRELEGERERELEVELSTQLVKRDFEGIPGIGGVLKDRIVRGCFDGRLSSLKRVREVEGIGEEKADAVQRWVRETEAKMSQLLLQDFPGKAWIMEKYAEASAEIEGRLRAYSSELERLLGLKGEAAAALEALEGVDTSTFVEALKGDIEAKGRVASYLIGVYPQWGRRPEWFSILMEEYC